ncbi:MarR family winged helix-turn-helix transcriptional regulator [Salisediminibacterium beveridgei]|uniref:Transcriptional regulator, MarR family n=1 Tax=Salisediminibacterium beveridgei TaxID=632773 RepID=A0A1D7QYU3_9BACI|nr:MarR family transcriptional regulator [Salisediminibacterium beveridgei]AOM84170.1 Transcriptional regulator, MarR family [Salisediminibacterium beveridgei]
MSDEINHLLGYQLSLTAHLLQNEHNRRLSELDMTGAQSKAIYLLKRFGRQSQTALQERMYIKGSTMNGIIDSLDKKALIEKSDSASDRRVKEISLTESGIHMEEQIWGAIKELEEKLTSGLTDQEKEKMLEMLHTIQENVSDGHAIERK